jgi:hypothetical protein
MSGCKRTATNELLKKKNKKNAGLFAGLLLVSATGWFADWFTVWSYWSAYRSTR